MKAKFIKAVDTADIVSTRLFLANELMLDPRGETFHEMKIYAESRLNNLYEPDNGHIYDETEDAWNEKFLFNLKNDLDFNFSKERLAFYEKVVKVVLKEKAASLDEEEHKSSSYTHMYSNTFSSDTNENKNSKKKIYTTITAGSAVVALTGLCVSKMALASLGVAGMVIGGVLLYNESKK